MPTWIYLIPLLGVVALIFAFYNPSCGISLIPCTGQMILFSSLKNLIKLMAVIALVITPLIA